MGGWGFERMDAGQNLVEDHAQAEDVRAVIVFEPHELFGGDISWCTVHATKSSKHWCRAVGRSARRAKLREAPVGDVHFAEIAEQNILRLHVAVHDAALMGICERSRHLDKSTHQPYQGPLRLELR